MRPELVLDANGKQERFKKYLRKKNEERQKAEELSNEETTKPMPPLQPIPGVGYPLNVLLHQMQPFYPEPQTSFPSQLPNLPLPFRFPISKQVDAGSRIPSPPPASPRPVDLTSHPLNRGSCLTSPSISSPVKYIQSYREATKMEEDFAKTAQLPALTKLHRSSVIANPGPAKKVYQEEIGADLVERESSSERDEASSSKRRYWPLHPLLENTLPLHVEIKVEPDQDQEQDQDQELVTEESLLHKYCHKKFQKAKTFSSDLPRPVAENCNEGENRKRRSVIVQAPSSKKPCSQDLRSFRISKPNNSVEEQEQEQESKVAVANHHQHVEEDEEEGSPVDLSCSSPTFQQASWPSPRRRQSSDLHMSDQEKLHMSDQEVPTA